MQQFPRENPLGMEMNMGIAKHGMGGNGMGMKQSHGPPQAWARGGTLALPGNVIKCFVH